MWAISLQTFYGKRPHRLLWAGSRASRRKIAVGASPNCLNYCLIFVVYAYKQFTNVAEGRCLAGHAEV
jgi:hypothetical protein